MDLGAGADIERDLQAVIRRLIDEFGAPTEVVQETVRQAAGPFGDARIKTFVPVLVERRAREQLRGMATVPLPEPSVAVAVQLATQGTPVRARVER